MRLARSAGSTLLLIILIVVAARFEAAGEAERETLSADGRPVHIIDGDSLRIGGVEIRIAGIDAPEYRQNCADAAGRPWPCGEAARDELERLAEVGGLSCETRATDRYGRALALCRNKDGDIGAAMARAGLALDAGDRRFEAPTAEVAEARRARRGIWQGAHQHPAEWRKAQRGAKG